MKIPSREITVANRFIYYYANFVERFYGYVMRRDGRNVAGEHYVGRLKESALSTRSRPGRKTSHPAIRRRLRERPLQVSPSGRKTIAEAVRGEIVLFLYRKRLMLGYYSHPLWGKRICIAAEDGRRLVIRRRSLVYLTGVGVNGNRDFLRTYGASVRTLAKHIDLEEIWHVLRDDQPVYQISDIGALLWGDDPDPSRWLALYIHLDAACPYFVRSRTDTCRPLESDEVKNRMNHLAGNETLTHELAEFLYWLGDDEEPYDPKSLTGRQRDWLEQIRGYALWGIEADRGGRAREMLRQLDTAKGDRRRYAFELMVRKRIWDPDEDLDLLRADLSPDFTAEVLSEADGIDLAGILKGRRRLRRGFFSIQTPTGDQPELAFSLKRRWRGGYELGVHIPDVTAYVPTETALDRAASDRLATLQLPDLTLPMLPPRLTDDIGRFKVDRRRPAVSLLWILDRNLNLGDLRVVLSSIKLRKRLTAGETEAIDTGEHHRLSGPLRILGSLTRSLREQRERRGAIENFGQIRVKTGNGGIVVQQTDPADPGAGIHHELALLAAVELGRWCAHRNIPAIYLTQDAVLNRLELDKIHHPIVRRHEIRRKTPYPTYSAEPDDHHGYGIRACCAAVAPCDRYTDLMVQRQIVHYLRIGAPLYTAGELDAVRYRAREEYVRHADLRRRREHFLVLNQLETLKNRTLSAIVLHSGRDGALIELEEFPIKTRVHAPRSVRAGDTLKLRVTGVDRWRRDPHFLVL